LPRTNNLPAPDSSLAADHPQRNDQALAYLRGLLLDGGLEPDQQISTDEVARRLGISRAPATDAVKRLARDGFLEIVPQVGCRVRAPRSAEVEDFYQLFARSEALITGFAAARRTEDQVRCFDGVAREVDARTRDLSSREGAGPELRALNRRRYEAIHELAGSPIAAELVSNMWDRSDFYVRIAFGEFVVSRSVQARFRKIATAIRRRDPETASHETCSYLVAVGGSAAKRLALSSAATPED
jgi:DNA-binding GntR family transcriptional regulator